MSTNQLTSILDTMLDMEKRLSELRDIINTMNAVPAKGAKEAKVAKVAKPRAENPWLTFNTRIDALMTANGETFASIGESKQFAAHLKSSKGYEWTDEDILLARESWAADHPPICSICGEDPTEHLDEHRDCIITLVKDLTEKGKKIANPVEYWMRTCGMKVVKSLTTIEEEPKVQKKRGRPPMTDEQKAAAAAERLAKANKVPALEGELESVVSVV